MSTQPRFGDRLRNSDLLLALVTSQRTLRSRLLRFLLPVALVFAVSPQANAACPPVAEVACPECFAVAVIPDTQRYTLLLHQPAGAAHLALITRYLCDHATNWQEPSTGKVMPIAMTLHLGDLVQSGDLTEAGAGALAEWARIDAAMDNLDACNPVIPYLTTTGNHDYHNGNYEGRTLGYETYFGTDRWTNAGYDCADPANCAGTAGEWFIGGGDPIAAFSRNNVNVTGLPGPASVQAGRHRAGVILAPNQQRFVFMGAEIAFDFPPAAPGFELTEGDDSAWIKNVLADYPNDPTIFFHHSMLLYDPDYVFGPEIFRSDSLAEGPPFDTGLGMEAIWNEVVVPYPQMFLAFSGHVINPAGQDDFTLTRTGAPDIAGVLRNYQQVSLPGVSLSNYGVGWTVMAVFDPETDEVRIRSYRIDDTDAYAEIDYEHTGTPEPTECLDMDYLGVTERTVAFTFAESPAVPAVSSTRLGIPVLVAIVAAAGFSRRSIARATRNHRTDTM